MSCLPCSKVSQSEQDVIKFYKRDYDRSGRVWWVYRLYSKDTFKVIENAYFDELMENHIKPNRDNGAEAFHIAEFNV